MISLGTRPLPPSKYLPFLTRPERGKHLTIALGYTCEKGVVVAADTMVVIGYETYEGSKLRTERTPSGSFGFVNSSNDANATATLIEDICHELRQTTIKTYRDLGKVVRARMIDWRNGFGRKKPPENQIILGAKLVNQSPALFFCEPPNTFIEKEEYVAAGAGASVSDPLYHMLFRRIGIGTPEISDILKRIAYLVYRAKNDSLPCGKKTECAIVHEDGKPITEVSTLEMDRAEKACRTLDFLLSKAAISALQDGRYLKRNVGELTRMLTRMQSLKEISFRDNQGKELTWKAAGRK